MSQQRTTVSLGRMNQVQLSFCNVQRKRFATAFGHQISNTMNRFSHELIAGCVIEFFCEVLIGFTKDEIEYCGYPNEVRRQAMSFAVLERPTDELQKKRAV